MHYKRNLSELQDVQKNGYKVFSCFSCWWGSTMWYKYNWFDVIGTCEIDPQMDKVYRHNFWNTHNFLMWVQDFKNIPDNEIPQELFDIDILDGSPPCSTFSMAGIREKARWKEKKFREGQAEQILSDLFFDFLDVAKKLNPKIIVAENVWWMLKGNAKWYVKMVLQRFDEIWYKVQLFLLNGATMWLPQRRERVFFIAHRKEFDLPKLSLTFQDKPITFWEVKSPEGKITAWKYHEMVKKAKNGERNIEAINMRINNKSWWFNSVIVWDKDICPTIAASWILFRWCDATTFSDYDLSVCWSYPLDYKVIKGISKRYIIWMSVPPLMMHRISKQIQIQRLDKIETKKSVSKKSYNQ